MSNSEAESRYFELVSFIRNKSGQHEMEITRETLLEDDLLVTGEDAYELILEQKKYQIDISTILIKPGLLSPGFIKYAN